MRTSADSHILDKLMKVYVTSLLLFVCLVACGQESEGQSQAQDGNSTQTTSNEGSLAGGDLEKKEACEHLDKSVVAEVMGWEAENVTAKVMMSWEKRGVTVCHYNWTDKNLLVRLAWTKERSIENKNVSKQFQQLLDEGEQGLVYEELESESGTQMLFGYGKDYSGQNQYIARKRFGEKLVMQVECTAVEDDLDGYREKLTRLLGRIGSN